MKLFIGLLLIVSGLGAFWGLRQHPGSSQVSDKTSGAPGPVIVELFTSEGCSSCPPADVLLFKLDQQPIDGVEIIGLSEHVDYWDDLGWRDPYSSAEFSKRQSVYAKSSGVYTPQMIVDGGEQFVGSDEKRARAAIISAAAKAKGKVEVTRPSVDAEKQVVSLSIHVSDVPPINDDDTAEVLLAITESKLSSEVPSGENAGRLLKHTAVVRHLETVGEVDPQTRKFTADKTVPLTSTWQRNNLRIVVFVQERRTRRLLGAREVKLTG